MSVMTHPSPGALLEEKIKAKNLNQGQAADLIGISRQYLNGVINGKYPFTADLGLKLKEPLGLPPEFWTEAVRNYEEFLRSDQGQRVKRAKDEEALLLDFELQSARTLVDYQILAALDAGYLGISPAPGRDRVMAASVVLSLDLKGSLYSRLGGISEPVATKPALVLKHGETVYISTLEKVRLPSRITGHVLGLHDSLEAQCLHLSCARTLEPGHSPNHVTFSLTNIGPFTVRLSYGDPCLVIAFEFLSQEPVRPR
jgi:plasmid maintenance system antidote protein VapI/deoxycytidine triphosphate deaminase